IVSNSIMTLGIDNDGLLWVGSSSEGVSKFDGTSWTVYNSLNTGVSLDVNVYAISFDNQNNPWIGTYAGISYFDGANWHQFTAENSGLPAGGVMDIEFDNYENVWIATNGGGIGVYNSNGVQLDITEQIIGKTDFECNIYPVPF